MTLRLSVLCRLKKFVIVIIVLLVLINLLSYVTVFQQSMVSSVINIKWFATQYTESKSNNSKCNTVHIGIVYTGYEPSIYLYTMLKSLLFHRSCPLHFHIIVDTISALHVKTMFTTWAVPLVTVNYYTVNSSMSDQQWMFKNLKLTFPNIISRNITDKIIVLDTDLTFTDDINKMWNLFNDFTKYQIIGLTENQNLNSTENELINSTDIIPRKRFNTGIILYYLKRFETTQWNSLYTKTAKDITSQFEDIKISDEDMLNAIISKNSFLLHYLLCYWNTRINILAKTYTCYGNNKIKIVQWNPPRTFLAIDKDEDYYRSIRNIFFKYNGSFLRKGLYNSSYISENISMKPLPQKCSEFYKAHNYNWRTLSFFREFKYISTGNDITLVSQLTYNRLNALEELGKRWNGPMSITFYVTDSELFLCMSFIENSEVLQKRFDIAYHAVFKEDLYYPINLLRNVALRYVITPFVFLNDIDFVPMQNLHSVSKKYIDSMEYLEKKVFVVPAFQMQKFKTNIPQDKQQLLLNLKKKTVFPFSYRQFTFGHGPTNYTRWLSTNGGAPYKIKWQPKFEPFVIVQSNVSKYDERFVGYGFNKISHITTLAAQGYEFMVLPDAFIVHKLHKRDHDKDIFVKSRQYRECTKYLYNEAIKELIETYPILKRMMMKSGKK